jgi:hypothetical protein
MTSRNPLEWPIVEHRRYLIQALSPETAVPIHDWPFGNHLRCIKRIWSEQAEKGSQKLNWRNVSQTTTKEFNHRYTDKLDTLEVGQSLDSDYNAIKLTTGRPFWNKADASTYHTFCCWEQMQCKPVPDMPDEQATLAVQTFCLTINSGPAELIIFLDRIQPYRELLSAQQIISLRRVETIGRRYNVSKWPEPIKWKLWGLPDD